MLICGRHGGTSYQFYYVTDRCHYMTLNTVSM